MIYFNVKLYLNNVNIPYFIHNPIYTYMDKLNIYIFTTIN